MTVFNFREPNEFGEGATMTIDAKTDRMPDHPLPDHSGTDDWEDGDMPDTEEAVMSAVSELLPCPWHGDNTELQLEDNGVGCFWVICAKHGCGCEGPYSHTPADAFAAWNRRSGTLPSGVMPEMHGPYGWLNGHRALSEDSWTLESDPLENSEEYFAIPLYATVDPFKEIDKSGPSVQPVSNESVFDWLKTELSAIDLVYRGDPTHDRDAYWMRDRVVSLIEDARKAFAAPQPTVPGVTEAMVERAHRAQMGELFVLCQPNNGNVFAFMDDRKDVMRAALEAALEQSPNTKGVE